MKTQNEMYEFNEEEYNDIMKVERTLEGYIMVVDSDPNLSDEQKQITINDLIREAKDEIDNIKNPKQ